MIKISITSVLLALLASMGGFIFGYDTGQISDILLMDDFKLRFANNCGTGSGITDAGSCVFSDVRSGLIVSLLSIGTLLGALMGAPTADWLGRRRAMSVECVVFCVGVVIQLCTFSAWYQFAIGRLVSGFGVGALSAAVPMYQAETAPRQIRGTLTGTYQLFITFGILVAYCISIGTRDLAGAASWRVVVGIGIVWAAILGFGILLMPESPRWSALNSRHSAAINAISRVHNLPISHPTVQLEMAEIERSIEKEQRIHERGGDGWLDCFRGYKKDKELFVGQGGGVGADGEKVKEAVITGSGDMDLNGGGMVGYRTLLGMSLQSLQQLTGANYFFYYGATVFQSVGLQDSFITQIILGSVNFICTFGGLYVMERFGRRLPLIYGGLWQSAWLFIFAAVGTARDPSENEGIGHLMIVAACMFILGYAMTWARNGIWILIGETFPTRTRAKQGALSTASNWLWNFLLAFFTPFIVRSINFSYGFVFAGCNLLGAIVVWMFLYESSGLSLEAIDLMYRDPGCKPWTSRRWAPPGFESRKDVEAATQRAQAQKIEGGASATSTEDETVKGGTEEGAGKYGKLGGSSAGADEKRTESVTGPVGTGDARAMNGMGTGASRESKAEEEKHERVEPAVW